MGCRLWGRTESDRTEVTYQQQHLKAAGTEQQSRGRRWDLTSAPLKMAAEHTLKDRGLSPVLGESQGASVVCSLTIAPVVPLLAPHSPVPSSMGPDTSLSTKNIPLHPT